MAAAIELGVAGVVKDGVGAGSLVTGVVRGRGRCRMFRCMGAADPLQEVKSAGRLIVIRGRPGTGTTTLAKGAARELPACYLRVDAAETALVRTGMTVMTDGYAVIHELAVSNLRLGHAVVVDAVNPVPQARAGGPRQRREHARD